MTQDGFDVIGRTDNVCTNIHIEPTEGLTFRVYQEHTHNALHSAPQRVLLQCNFRIDLFYIGQSESEARHALR